MPHLLGSFILVTFGTGFLIIAFHGYRAGVLPAGAAGLRPYRPNRNDDPLAFHVFLSLYVCGGVALVIWGLLAVFGAAPVLKLR